VKHTGLVSFDHSLDLFVHERLTRGGDITLEISRVDIRLGKDGRGITGQLWRMITTYIVSCIVAYATVHAVWLEGSHFHCSV